VRRAGRPCSLIFDQLRRGPARDASPGAEPPEPPRFRYGSAVRRLSGVGCCPVRACPGRPGNPTPGWRRRS